MDKDSFMHEDIIMLVERNEQGNPVLRSNASFAEAHGIVVHLVGALANHADIPYNQMLEELREVIVTEER